jgi:hypothetical protein
MEVEIEPKYLVLCTELKRENNKHKYFNIKVKSTKKHFIAWSEDTIIKILMLQYLNPYWAFDFLMKYKELPACGLRRPAVTTDPQTIEKAYYLI